MAEKKARKSDPKEESNLYDDAKLDHFSKPKDKSKETKESPGNKEGRLLEESGFEMVPALTDLDDLLLPELNLRGCSTSPGKPVSYEMFPNGIYCLLQFYTQKYRQMKSKTIEQIHEMDIWDYISLQMRRSFFYLKPEEVKQKYKQLRDEYFNIKSRDDIRKFYFFMQVHDIYGDPFINAIHKGGPQKDLDKMKPARYIDEELVNCGDDVNRDIQVIYKEPNYSEIINEEIQALKNIGAAKKKAMEESKLGIKSDMDNRDIKALKNKSSSRTAEHPMSESTLGIKHELDNKNISSKRLKKGKSGIACTPEKNDEANTSTSPSLSLPELGEPPVFVLPSPPDMTLAEFNGHQERRHLHKAVLLEKILNLQNRAIEMQRKLLESIIKLK